MAEYIIKIDERTKEGKRILDSLYNKNLIKKMVKIPIVDEELSEKIERRIKNKSKGSVIRDVDAHFDTIWKS